MYFRNRDHFFDFAADCLRMTADEIGQIKAAMDKRQRDWPEVAEWGDLIEYTVSTAEFTPGRKRGDWSILHAYPQDKTWSKLPYLVFQHFMR